MGSRISDNVGRIQLVLVFFCSCCNLIFLYRRKFRHAHGIVAKHVHKSLAGVVGVRGGVV